VKRSIAGIAMRKNKILVAKRKEGGAIGLRWEFPGGKVEEDEPDEEALKREFDEEFGIVVTPLKILGTSSFLCGSGEMQLAAWLVEIPHDSILELREHSRVAWVPAAELETLDLADSDRTLLQYIVPLFKATGVDRS
jgi:8-oxo-dGTP diphosphatase